MHINRLGLSAFFIICISPHFNVTSLHSYLQKVAVLHLVHQLHFILNVAQSCQSSLPCVSYGVWLPVAYKSVDCRALTQHPLGKALDFSWNRPCAPSHSGRYLHCSKMKTSASPSFRQSMQGSKAMAFDSCGTQAQQEMKTQIILKAYILFYIREVFFHCIVYTVGSKCLKSHWKSGLRSQI